MNSNIKYRISMGIIVFAVLIQCVSVVSASSTTSTGFKYPTGNPGPYSYSGWLAGGPGMPSYFSGFYHIGQDMEAPVGTNVYPISDGEIVYVSVSGWGANNYGIVVKHTLDTGQQFLALYGHVRPFNTKLQYSTPGNVNPPIPVSTGIAFGTIGPYNNQPHLHFGILPGTTHPSTNWGMMPIDKWTAKGPDLNGFVDPINWITTHKPKNTASPGLPTALTQYKSNGVNGITVGGTTTESTVVMKGGVSDPSGNTVKLDVEVKPINTGFAYTPTKSSALVASGSTASVNIAGLANGQYQWQARATNSQGVSGPWQSAGGNADNAIDFIVSAATPVTLTVSPSSGKQGTTFTISGTGYTPNGAIAYHVKKPDNTEFPVTTLTASSSGSFTYPYKSTTASMVGTYTIWAIDSATSRQSKNVQETITKNQKLK